MRAREHGGVHQLEGRSLARVFSGGTSVVVRPVQMAAKSSAMRHSCSAAVVCVGRLKSCGVHAKPPEDDQRWNVGKFSVQGGDAFPPEV